MHSGQHNADSTRCRQLCTTGTNNCPVDYSRKIDSCSKKHTVSDLGTRDPITTSTPSGIARQHNFVAGIAVGCGYGASGTVSPWLASSPTICSRSREWLDPVTHGFLHWRLPITGTSHSGRESLGHRISTSSNFQLVRGGDSCGKPHPQLRRQKQYRLYSPGTTQWRGYSAKGCNCLPRHSLPHNMHVHVYLECRHLRGRACKPIGTRCTGHAQSNHQCNRPPSLR
jgi:hypothetical protein